MIPVLLTLPACLLLLDTLGRATEHAALERAVESIKAEDLDEITSVLADDTLEGREAGTRGGYTAGGYIVQRLARLKLQPAGDDDSYYQPFGAGYRNILAMLRGSDPELGDEVIVIGAHYDHVGYGTRRNSYGPIGYIHNGADDNASGTAAILEIAEALTRLPEPPARTILFAFWDGEEKGLLGSKHWIAAPTVPREKIVFAMNFDMVGRLRDNRVEVYGAHTGIDLRKLLVEENDEDPLKLDFIWTMKANSDHHVFFAQHIPVVMLHTGLHDDYHRPSDDVERLNCAGIARISQYACRMIVAVADGESTPEFREDSQWEDASTPRRLREPAGPPPLRLGVWWSLDESSPHPLVVSHVVADSPAAKAGLEIGDRLIRLGDIEATAEDRFRQAVASSPIETKLIVTRSGEDKPVTIPVKLAGVPRLLGIQLRTDPANPGLRVISDVAPGSPAAAAGLVIGDRLYAVNGKACRDDSLDELFEPSEEGTWHLQVERQGTVQTIVARKDG